MAGPLPSGCTPSSRGVRAGDVVRRSDVEDDDDVGTETGHARTPREAPDLLLRERARHHVAGRGTRVGHEPCHLERDVRAHSIVERPGDEAPVRQLERLAVEHHRVAWPDQGARLVGVTRADVDVQVVDLDRARLLVAVRLGLAPRHDAANLPAARHEGDPLADEHLRVESTDPPHGEEAVLVDVRHDQTDLVDVSEHGERRPVPARNAHVGGAEHVGRHLTVGRRGVAPDA